MRRSPTDGGMGSVCMARAKCEPEAHCERERQAPVRGEAPGGLTEGKNRRRPTARANGSVRSQDVAGEGKGGALLANLVRDSDQALEADEEGLGVHVPLGLSPLHYSRCR